MRAQTSGGGRADCTDLAGEVPFLGVAGVRIVHVGGGDQAERQRVEAELAIELQPHLQPLSYKARFEGTIVLLTLLAELIELTIKAAFAGAVGLNTHVEETLLRTDAAKFFVHATARSTA